MRRPILSSASAIASILSPFAPAAAQTVDYSALQAMIGEPVTTSVIGSPQRASEVPASTVIITAAQIARSPARDVPGLLKSYAGIDVNHWTAGQNDVAVRGGVQTFNARLLVLVDGRQVYLDHYGMTNWNLLGVQLEEIQQIELVRGPASALFGFNAASGVVNIITRQAPGKLTATIAASAGDHGFSRLAGSIAVPVADGIAARLTAGRLREDERRDRTDLLGPLRQHDVESTQVSGTVTARRSGTEAVIGGGYSFNRQMEFVPSQIASNQAYRSGTVHAGLTHDTGWGGLSLTGFVNWMAADYGRDAAQFLVTPPFTIDNRIIAVKGSGTYRLGGGSVFRLGGEYRTNRNRGSAQFARTIAYDVGSLDAMLDLKLNDRVTFTGAARIDQLSLGLSGAVTQPAFDDPAAFDRDFARVSVNAALLVRAGANGLLRINGGHGYQLPSLVNLGFRLPLNFPTPPAVVAAGSPTIEPVGTWSGEFGYMQTLGQTKVEATGFYNRTSNAIAPPGDGAGAISQLVFKPDPIVVVRYTAAGDYSTYGVELSATGQIAALTWRANYTLTETDGDLTGVTLPIVLSLSPRSTTARHKANLELGYDEGGRWYATTLARYTSSTRQFSFVATGQLLLLDVDRAIAVDGRAGYRLSSRLEMFVAGENLTLAGGAAGSPIPADRRVRGGIRVTL